MKAIRSLLSAILLAVAICFFGVSAARSRAAQAASQKPSEKIPEKTQEKPRGEPAAKASPEVPAQIELLETRVRFETDGSSRKEVHARVKINDELGVRQFARLSFDFNRSFQQVEIPLVRITHPSGGVIDVLPSAITDQPNPAVINAPAYQDVRVKSVRILGLEPGDKLEYRVITTTSYAPLAPDFWLDHTFDRSGVVSHEIFEVGVPVTSSLRVQINPATTPESISRETVESGDRRKYLWSQNFTASADTVSSKNSSSPDVSISTFYTWDQLADRLSTLLIPSESDVRAAHEKAASLVNVNSVPDKKMVSIYDFVSQKIRTVDLPLGSTGYRARKPADIIASGYGTPEDKFALFAALGNNFFGPARAGFVSSSAQLTEDDTPSPSRFDHLLTMSGYPSITVWMDLNVEVAPFSMIPPQFRDKPVFVVGPAVRNRWEKSIPGFPVRSTQNVRIEGKLGIDGKLTARVKYSMRGDNELLLRVAFHQTPKENWKNVAQLLALSDGFRGQITDVSASDPYETHTPFAVEYEIVQPMFVNWSKKPVRIPALLPLLGLPDPAGRTAPGTAAKPIELGTPLDVEVSATVHLPEGTGAEVPAGTSVERDFATYTSQYSVKDATITATRHLNFILKEIPAERAADYDAFLQAVQNDESQFFTLERTETNAAKPSKP
ncbi:MAG: DUF3857 domain-containing protein [Candidatus Acidiferrum sp.]